MAKICSASATQKGEACIVLEMWLGWADIWLLVLPPSAAQPHPSGGTAGISEVPLPNLLIAQGFMAIQMVASAPE